MVSLMHANSNKLLVITNEFTLAPSPEIQRKARNKGETNHGIILEWKVNLRKT